MQLFTPVAQISQQSDYWIDLQRGNWDRLQRLLPLKRAHTEVEHDVQVTHVAMDQVPSSIVHSNSCFFLQIVRNLRKLLGTMMVGTGF